MAHNPSKVPEWIFNKLLGAILKLVTFFSNEQLKVSNGELEALKLGGELLSNVIKEEKRIFIVSFGKYQKYIKSHSVWAEEAGKIYSQVNEILILDKETVISRIKSKDLLNMLNKIIEHLKRAPFNQEMITDWLNAISLKPFGSFAETKKKISVLEKARQFRIRKPKYETSVVPEMEEKEVNTKALQKLAISQEEIMETKAKTEEESGATEITAAAKATFGKNEEIMERKAKTEEESGATEITAAKVTFGKKGENLSNAFAMQEY